MHEEDPMYPTECAVCGSARIIPDVQIVDKDESMKGDLQVRIARNPAALFFKGMVYQPLRAWICGDCGHVELFVPNPQELYEAYLTGLTATEQP